MSLPRLNTTMIFQGAPSVSRRRGKHFIEIPITLHHNNPAWFYPDHCLLSKEQASESVLWHPADMQQEAIAFAQRLIDFSDSLGLPSIKTPAKRHIAHELYPAWYGRQYYQFGYSQMESVFLDSPRTRSPLEGDNALDWEVVWLPETCSPIRPGLGFPRLATRRHSCLNLARLAERVAYLDFPPIACDLWGF